jgi:hypothetical protein
MKTSASSLVDERAWPVWPLSSCDFFSAQASVLADMVQGDVYTGESDTSESEHDYAGID